MIERLMMFIMITEDHNTDEKDFTQKYEKKGEIIRLSKRKFWII